MTTLTTGEVIICLYFGTLIGITLGAFIVWAAVKYNIDDKIASIFTKKNIGR